MHDQSSRPPPTSRQQSDLATQIIADRQLARAFAGLGVGLPRLR